MSELDMRASKLGHDAQIALDIIDPAIDGIIDTLLASLRAAPIGQNEHILSIHAALSATQKVKVAITSIIANGQLAEHALMQASILNGDAK